MAVVISAVILESPKIKSATVSTVSPSICHEVMGPDAIVYRTVAIIWGGGISEVVADCTYQRWS